MSHHHLYPTSTYPPLSNPLSTYSAYGSSGGGLHYGSGAGAGVGAASNSYYSSDNSHLLSSEPSSRLLGGGVGDHQSYGSSASYISRTPPPPQSLQLSGWNNPPAFSWHQTAALSPLDPPMTGMKRPNEEAFYPGDGLSKRPRVDSVPNLPVYPQRPGEKDCAFYMKTRTCSFGASCKFDHPPWVPAGGIPDWKEVSTPSNDSLPARPGEPECTFYMKTGVCKFGSKCKFNHPKDRTSTLPEKKGSEQNGTIFNNTKANAEAKSTTIPKSSQTAISGVGDGANNAPMKPASSFNSKGLPIRPGESDCAFFMKKGSCKFGSTCRFNHPDNNPGVAVPQAQQTGIPFLGGLSGGAGRPSSFSGALSDYGLSSAASGYGISVGGVQSLSLLTSAYPQRPGEKECVYFLKTGNCKFGATCRFHHPLVRLDPSYVDPGVKLTLAGLPRHEGEGACSYYMKTGACKYGSNCRFDHPPPGEAAEKALAEASKTGQESPSDNDDDSNLELKNVKAET